MPTGLAKVSAQALLNRLRQQRSSVAMGAPSKTRRELNEINRTHRGTTRLFMRIFAQPPLREWPGAHLAANGVAGAFVAARRAKVIHYPRRSGRICSQPGVNHAGPVCNSLRILVITICRTPALWLPREAGADAISAMAPNFFKPADAAALAVGSNASWSGRRVAVLFL